MSNSSQKNKHSPNGSGLPGRLFDRLNTGLAVLAGLILLFMTFSISSSILARALEVPFPVWVVQFNEYGLLWMTFLATAWVLKRDKHVSIDLLTGKLPTLANRTLAIVQNLVCGAFCAVLFWHSLSVTWDHFQRGIIDVKGVDVPKYLILVVIPVGFLLLTLQFFRNVYTFLVKAKESSKSPEEEKVYHGL